MNRSDFLKTSTILGEFVDNLFPIINLANAAERLDTALKFQ